MPSIRAPQAFRYLHRASTSGSLAAPSIRVQPLAVTAASRIFSVAPTLGRARRISAPRSPSGARPQILSPSSEKQTPICSSARRCRSMGRLPITQPPGYSITMLPQRASKAPRRHREERIPVMASAGISRVVILPVPMQTPSPSQRTCPPRLCSSLSIRYTSEILGQSLRKLSPSAKIVAARMGNAAFLDPCIFTLPWRRTPPRIWISPVTFCGIALMAQLSLPKS